MKAVHVRAYIHAVKPDNTPLAAYFGDAEPQSQKQNRGKKQKQIRDKRQENKRKRDEKKNEPHNPAALHPVDNPAAAQGTGHVTGTVKNKKKSYTGNSFSGKLRKAWYRGPQRPRGKSYDNKGTIKDKSRGGVRHII
jgi:hypothetical protein